MIIISLMIVSSCKKFLEVDPPKSTIPKSAVFASESAANLAVIAIYSTLIDGTNFSSGDLTNGVTMLCGLSADELVNHPKNNALLLEFEENDLTAINGSVLNLWASAYKVIYMANAVLEGVSNSSSFVEETKSKLEGEALFIRAFSHFYLVNLFGDIPLVTSTDYTINAQHQRTPADKVYEQITQDLTRAKELLNAYYTSDGRTRANRGAAEALLARVYLYTGNWINAEIEATSVINNPLYKLTELNNVFLANSEEAIWQLRPLQVSGSTGYTFEASYFTPPDVINNNVLRSEIINAFEVNDERFDAWVGKYNAIYYPHKYKQNSLQAPLTEYSMVMRTAEQYLIRAEARAHQGKLTGQSSAESDINMIRERAELDSTSASSFDQIVQAIEQERRIELFTEWGHRWFDLKRTDRTDAVLDPLKPKWSNTDALYPIPQKERNNNPNLKPQNPGY